MSAQNALTRWRLRRKKGLFAKHLGGVLTSVLGKAGVAYLSSNVTCMLYPNHASRTAGNRHYLYLPASGWSEACPLTAGSMANTGEITGGSQSISVAGTTEYFSVIWNNSGLPVVAFSIGFNRSLTTAERTALSAVAFWSSILPAAIDTDDCTALYPYLAPDYQNLVGWWDASTIVGLSNNDPVSSWTDKSGLANAVAQSTADSKPIYKTNQQNGLPALIFDGADFLSKDAIAAHFTGDSKPMSCITVVKCDSGWSGYDYAVTLSGGSLMFGCAYEAAAAAIWKTGASGSTGGFGAAYDATAKTHINATIFSASNAAIWIDGDNKVPETGVNVGASVLTNFRIGNWSGGGSGHTGKICACMLWRSALSTSARAIAEQFLASQWGITLA